MKTVYLPIIIGILMNFPLTAQAGTHFGIISAAKDKVNKLREKVAIAYPNQPPYINSLQTDPVTIGTGSSVTITCQASDPEGDRITYSWSASAGVCTGQGNKGFWICPDQIGAYTLTCKATDEHGASSQKDLAINADYLQIVPGTYAPQYPDYQQMIPEAQPKIRIIVYTGMSGTGLLDPKNFRIELLKENTGTAIAIANLRITTDLLTFMPVDPLADGYFVTRINILRNGSFILKEAFGFYVDATAPIVTVSANASPYSTNNPEMYIQYTLNDSTSFLFNNTLFEIKNALTQAIVRNDGFPYSQAGGPRGYQWDFKDNQGQKVPDGQYTITVSSRDLAGNIGSGSATFTITTP